MSYAYYQQQPQWGTSQYQFVQPPQPRFQPQPNWGGNQYFQASLGKGYEDFGDDGFFDSVWKGIKDVFNRGFAREDAARWHARVYGGVTPVDQLDASQLGAAAGYEAIRHWSTYRATYVNPLADDRERILEALAGLAAGEAVKLLRYSTRRRSGHTRREAAEIAAATAERIYQEDYEDVYKRPHLRRKSSSGVRRRTSSFGVATARPIVASTTGGSYVTPVATGGVTYAQPQRYVTQPQVQYVQTGTPVQYAATGQGLAYASTGGSYVQPQYVQQPMVGQQYTGASVVYPQQTGQFMNVPQGYTRARALSTGYQPQVYYQ